MKRPVFKILLLAVFIYTTANNLAGKEIDHVRLYLEIDPAKKLMKGTYQINNPDDSVFWLAKGLTVESVWDGRQKVGFHQLLSDSNSISAIWKPDKKCSHLKIIYSGNIIEENYPKNISNQNRINPEMLELTDVIDWYPRLGNTNKCTFSLNVTASKEFGFVTNGKQTRVVETGKTKQASFESVHPVDRIFLIGSTGLKISAATASGYDLQIYYSKLPDNYIAKMTESLAKTVEFYQNLYGAAGSDNLIKVIYSARPAGGYARGSVIVVSEEFAFDQKNSEWGFARDFQLNVHEIAHLWSKAKWDHDWINEGLAEFSAFLACEKFIGIEFANLLINEYNAAIENSATQLSILEITGESWESHINRYYKPTVLLNTLRQKYGEEKMAEFIALLNTAFIQNHGGTTEIFLNVLQESMGKEAFDFFQEGINRKNWMKERVKTAAEYDPDFEGTWSGALTQFGTTSRFVLHLKNEDNTLVAVLDSPDQNVFGIPVTELTISGDSITCVVAVASATFSGVLDRNAIIIRGNWNQRGTDYPLALMKE